MSIQKKETPNPIIKQHGDVYTLALDAVARAKECVDNITQSRIEQGMAVTRTRKLSDELRSIEKVLAQYV